jgi:hypothetical protein
MDQRKEQQACIKWSANSGNSATETLTMIQLAFGDQTLSHMQVFQWHAYFKTSHTSVDVEHTGYPQAAQLLKLLHEFKSLSVRIDVGPFTTLLRRWELVMGHANRF